MATNLLKGYSIAFVLAVQIMQQLCCWLATLYTESCRVWAFQVYNILQSFQISLLSYWHLSYKTLPIRIVPYAIFQSLCQHCPKVNYTFSSYTNLNLRHFGSIPSEHLLCFNKLILQVYQFSHPGNFTENIHSFNHCGILQDHVQYIQAIALLIARMFSGVATCPQYAQYTRACPNPSR